MGNDYLAHYGILGMKWGVRRTPAQLARARGRYKTDKSHEDYKKAHTSKSIKSMSDAELRNRLNRLQMERQCLIMPYSILLILFFQEWP